MTLRNSLRTKVSCLGQLDHFDFFPYEVSFRHLLFFESIHAQCSYEYLQTPLKTETFDFRSPQESPPNFLNCIRLFYGKDFCMRKGFDMGNAS